MDFRTFQNEILTDDIMSVYNNNHVIMLKRYTNLGQIMNITSGMNVHCVFKVNIFFGLLELNAYLELIYFRQDHYQLS